MYYGMLRLLLLLLLLLQGIIIDATNVVLYSGVDIDPLLKFDAHLMISI